jgi:hypothetical protein
MPSPTNTTPCNDVVEAFSFAEAEQLASRQGLVRHQLELDLMTYMNRFFAIIKGTTATYVEKTVRERTPSPVSFVASPLAPVPVIEYVYRTGKGFRDAMQNKTVVFHTVQTIRTRTAIRTVTEEETINLCDLWNRSKYRCEYDRIAFTEHADQGSFNIYHGLSISRSDLTAHSREQAMPWVQHIYDIWCRGDETLFDYVIRRFAMLVQRPFTKSKVAMVMSSRQGAGKGVVLAPIQEIFGKYFKALKPENVFGAFNDSVSDCLVLFLDECTIGGSKRSAAQLKTLITEKEHYINAKHLPGVMVENHINLFIATNERWSVHVEGCDRRYIVIQLDNRYAGKSTKRTHDYFSRVRSVPYQAVYLFLMGVDISGFVPTIYPTTEATRTQKLYGMDSVTAWVHQSLAEEVQWTTLPTITRQQLYVEYDAFVKNCSGQYTRRESSASFFSLIGELCGAERVEGSRTDIALPGQDRMKERLREYLDDEGFPI